MERFTAKEVTIEGGNLVFKNKDNPHIFELNSIKYIGEYEVDTGFVPAWYIVFGTNDNDWVQILKTNLDSSVWRKIQEYYHIDRESHIIIDSSFESAAIYPKSVAGKEFFQIKQQELKRNFFQKIIGASKYHYSLVLTEEIKAIL